jgi:hypothetical protein
MAVSELSDVASLQLLLVELERREADIERGLAPLLVRNGRSPDETTERQIAALRKDHLEVRRELNAIRARLVPVLPR